MRRVRNPNHLREKRIGSETTIVVRVFERAFWTPVRENIEDLELIWRGDQG